MLEYSFCDRLYLALGLYTRDIATQKPHSPDMGNSMLRSNTLVSQTFWLYGNIHKTQVSSALYLQPAITRKYGCYDCLYVLLVPSKVRKFVFVIFLLVVLRYNMKQ